MKNKLKNIACLLVINLFATSIFFLYVFYFIVAYTNIGLIQSISTSIETEYIILVLLVGARFLVLPIAYTKLENSQKFELVSKFIKNLKQSLWLKLLILVLAYFSWALWTKDRFFNRNFWEQITECCIMGLFGNYLVLYAYWFVEDKWKKRKSLLAK